MRSETIHLFFRDAPLGFRRRVIFHRGSPRLHIAPAKKSCFSSLVKKRVKHAKRPLREPPPELVAALAMPAGKRRAGRNIYRDHGLSTGWHSLDEIDRRLRHGRYRD